MASNTSSAEMSLNLAIKMVVLQGGSVRGLAKAANMNRCTLARYVRRFTEKFGSSVDEVISSAGLSVASSSTDSEEIIRKRRLDAVLSDDFNCVVPARKVGRPTYLSPEVEARIQKILAVCGDRQAPLNRRSARALIEAALAAHPVRSTKDGRLVKIASKHLVSNVLERGALSLKTAEKLEISSTSGLSKDVVRKYSAAVCENLDAFSPHAFAGDNVWNIDETGFCAESLGREKGIFLRCQRKCLKAENATGDRVSAMFAVSAAGRLGPVALVVPRVNLTASFIESTAALAKDWLIYGNEKGWFRIEEFRRYIEDFAKYLDRFRPRDRTDIVIMDNLGIHTNGDVIARMKELRLQPVYLPPRSTSYLQPLDVCLYGPLKTYFFASRDDEITRHVLEQMLSLPDEALEGLRLEMPELSLWDIPRFLHPAVGKVFLPDRIRKAFSTCGIYPYHEDVMLERLPEWAPEEGSAAPSKKRRRRTEMKVRVAQPGEDASAEAYLKRLNECRAGKT